MYKKSDGSGLSSIELVVLARYSAGKKPAEAVLGSELHRLGLATESKTQLVRQTVSALAASGLLTPPPPPPKAQKRTKKGAPSPAPQVAPVVFEVSDFTISEEGKRALRAIFGVANTPSWTEVRDAYLPALALGLQPGSAAASEAAANLPMSLLVRKLKLPKGAPLSAICDGLLLSRLGIEMSKITLAELRAHVLADALGVKDISTAKKVVEKSAINWTGAKDGTKKSLVLALSRRWLADQSNHWLHDGSPPSTSPPSRASAGPPPAAPSGALSLDALADVVHDALPRIGTDGRYGSEKVFVSAVWRGLEQERRLPTMTLDSFKRNLVQAMRAGKVRLARADLIGAMDSKLVSESEISDNGSTFHFVVEQRSGGNGNGRRAHV